MPTKEITMSAPSNFKIEDIVLGAMVVAKTSDTGTVYAPVHKVSGTTVVLDVSSKGSDVVEEFYCQLIDIISMGKIPKQKGIAHDSSDPFSITIDDIEIGDQVRVPTPETVAFADECKIYDILTVILVNPKANKFYTTGDKAPTAYTPSDVYHLDKKGS